MLTVQEINQPKQLLVEGRDEYVFFRALIKYLAISDIQIQNFGGIEQLRPFLGVLVNATNFDQIQSLGIARDAETNAENAFKSVRDTLQVYGLPLPNEPFHLVRLQPYVSVCILPGPTATSGMLEDLCLSSVGDDPALICVEQYFSCLQQVIALPKKLSKAKLQAFLASKDRPGLLLGEAANKGYWNWQHPSLEPIKAFLQAL